MLHFINHSKPFTTGNTLLHQYAGIVYASICWYRICINMLVSYICIKSLKQLYHKFTRIQLLSYRSSKLLFVFMYVNNVWCLYCLFALYWRILLQANNTTPISHLQETYSHKHILSPIRSDFIHCTRVVMMNTSWKNMYFRYSIHSCVYDLRSTINEKDFFNVVVLKQSLQNY